MKADPAFTRGRTAFVPLDQVMSMLMRRADARRRVWLDYLIPFIFAIEVLLGVSLAVRL